MEKPIIVKIETVLPIEKGILSPQYKTKEIENSLSRKFVVGPTNLIFEVVINRCKLIFHT
jgi:hypothetical protein